MTGARLRWHDKMARESDEIKFIPYTRHVDETAIALEGGALCRVYRVDGRPFETCDIADLNSWHNKLNVMWRSIGDDRLAVWTHLIRTQTDPVLGGNFHSDFARTLQTRYLVNLLFQQLIDLNVRELPSDGHNNVQLLLLLDEFARLGRASVIASGFSYVAGYGIRLLPVIQSRAQLRGVYGKEVTDEIIANCGVELVFRPKEWDAAKEISDRLGTYTFRARSRSMASWGGKGGSTSDSDQRRALLMPQELTLMSEDDLIVMRSGIPPVQGNKIRYYAEKAMLAKSRTTAPTIEPVKIDPQVAAHSLRIIASSERDEGMRPAGQAQSPVKPLDDSLIGDMAGGGSVCWAGNAFNGILG